MASAGPSSFDAIVVGLGAHGSAATWALTRRGLRVLGIEAGERGHELGSSGGRSRMIRRAYFEDPAYVPLLREARAGWAALAEARGEPMIEVCGGLYVGGEGSAVLEGSVASAREQGLDHEVLSAAEIRRQWPLFELADGFRGLWDPGAGLIRPERAIAACVSLAETAGADVRFGERVVDWRPASPWHSRDFDVQTDAATYRSRYLVIAAGAWTPYFVPDLALPIEVERVPVFWFEPVGDPSVHELDRLPVWIVDTDEGAFYGFPPDPGLGLKVARHHSGDLVRGDPSGVDRSARAADVARVRRFMATHVPAANGELRHSIACLYANTPDRHFVIDTHPAVAGVAFASACSGHGFKFAPVVGEVLADLALTGETSRPIERFRASRLGEANAE